MFLKKLSVLLAVAATGIVACYGTAGLSEGDECGGSSDDCSVNLQCVSITGRGHQYCCPTPTEASNYAVCHPTATTDTTPLH